MTRRIAFRLFATFWALYALHFATNIVRETYLALSIADQLSFDVSEYLGLHDDIFAIPGRGAFINNNPGASMLAAFPYTLARPVIDRIAEHSRRARAMAPASQPRDFRAPQVRDREFYRKAWERGLDVKLGLAAGVMQAWGMAPLSALSVAVMFRILASRVASIRVAAALAALYGIATPVFFRTAQLNQNLLVAHCALLGFAALWRPWDDPAGPRRPSYLLAGVLAGWAAVLDYSGLLVTVFLGAYGTLRRRALPAATRSSTDLWRLAAGVAASGSVLVWYQWVAFGHPLHPAQYYMPATEFSTLGHFGVTWPRVDLLWATAFGMQFGLFTSTPLLLLSLYPPAWGRRIRLFGATEAWCLAGFCLAFVLFCGMIQYGWWQRQTGVRYLVPASPFLFLAAAGVLLRQRPAVAVGISLLAAYWSWCLAMYRDVEQGLGVLESLIHVSLRGPRLPWLTTLERMGYVQGGLAPLFLAGFGLLALALWRRPAWSTAGRGPAPAS